VDAVGIGLLGTGVSQSRTPRHPQLDSFVVTGSRKETLERIGLDGWLRGSLTLYIDSSIYVDVTGDELIEVFKALADPTRFGILGLLRKKSRSRCGPVAIGEKGLCACDVESAVGLSQAAVSHHMGILRRAGLVTAQKRGRWTFYRCNDHVISAAAKALVEHVESGRPATRLRLRRASNA